MVKLNSIKLNEKFSLIKDFWTSYVIGELNGQYIKISKVKGEFVWHNHENEDEMFMVVKGELSILIKKDKKIEIIVIKENEIFIVERGTEHKPIANDECWIMLFEPIETKHTGEVDSELTNNELQRL